MKKMKIDVKILKNKTYLKININNGTNSKRKTEKQF